MINITRIEELEKNLINAIKTSDVSMLDQHLHNDLLFIGPDGKVITKQADLDSHRSGGMKVKRLEPTIEHYNIVGDIAIVVVVYDTEGSMLGKPIKGRFRYQRIWKSFPEGWKVIAGSCSKIL